MGERGEMSPRGRVLVRNSNVEGEKRQHSAWKSEERVGQSTLSYLKKGKRGEKEKLKKYSAII